MHINEWLRLIQIQIHITLLPSLENYVRYNSLVLAWLPQYINTDLQAYAYPCKIVKNTNIYYFHLFLIVNKKF